ncbi:acyltransferase domain-containing protein [Patescibacteria group bacterium]|nr:acyltransferase domain-containing protein [Patescibacteria group bacterium]
MAIQVETLPGLAIVFPPQNGRREGMLENPDTVAGKSYLEVIDRVRAIVGPETLASWQKQVTLVAVSLGLSHTLVEEFDNKQPEFVLGHSIGENPALVQRGIIDLEPLAFLVNERERLCREINVNPVGRGMAAVVGVSPEMIIDQLKQTANSLQVSLANINTPNQTILSGLTADVARFFEEVLVRNNGRGRLIPLSDITDAFHSPFMLNVEKEFRTLIDTLKENFTNPDGSMISPMRLGGQLEGWVKTAADGLDVAYNQLTRTVDYRQAWQNLTNLRAVVTIDPSARSTRLVRDNIGTKIPILNVGALQNIKPVAQQIRCIYPEVFAE